MLLNRAILSITSDARRGKHIAVVALARRLAGILYALLRDGTVFTPRPSPSPRAADATLAGPPRLSERSPETS